MCVTFKDFTTSIPTTFAPRIDDYTVWYALTISLGSTVSRYSSNSSYLIMSKTPNLVEVPNGCPENNTRM